MHSASELAAKIAHRAESILDFEMRVAYVGHEIGRMDSLQAVNVLAVVQQRAASGHARYCDLLLALSVYLAQPGAAELRACLHQVGQAVGLTELTDAVLALPESDESGPPSGDRSPDFGLGRPLTLGERKALARTANRNLLSRVVQDPHPDVVEILLVNPHLTEPDVVRLCARRPIAPAVLQEVFRSPRWARHYAVRLAILKNPCCPRDLALQLVPHLRAQDAAAVGASAELDAEVRARCVTRGRAETLH